MQGLRTQENSRFIRFFEEVQLEAKRNNSIFFLNFGMCEDIPFKDMEIDTLFGWLIPIEAEEIFEKCFLNWEVPDIWTSFLCWVEPTIINNKLQIAFIT